MQWGFYSHDARGGKRWKELRRTDGAPAAAAIALYSGVSYAAFDLGETFPKSGVALPARRLKSSSVSVHLDNRVNLKFTDSDRVLPPVTSEGISAHRA